MSDPANRCRDCGDTKPLTAFPRNRGIKDGYGIYCKSCYSIRYRDHRVRKAVAEGRTIGERRQLPPGQKWCPACESAQPTANFPSNRSASDGLAAYCKPCHNAKTRASGERLYGGSREYHLRRRYGLTSADVDAMIEAQGGTCATCDAKPQHVDHDHATGRVRGVLCFNCNQALGNVRDDPVTLNQLRRYLLRNRPAIDEFPTSQSPCELDLRDYLRRHRAG